MEFDAVFTVKKEIEKDSFLRKLLINLGTNTDTPVDVANATIGEVQESYKEIVVCTAKVWGICNASVGYDHEEPYTDYETYREQVGNSYVTRQRPVTKYRTVTDWSPFNTEYFGEATCVANNDKSYINSDVITTAIKTAKSDNIIQKGVAMLCPEGLEKAVWACESNVEHNYVSFPGDHHKDVRFNSTSKIESVSCYKLPYYEVKFNYNGKDYNASCFACGDLVVDYDVPPNNVDIDTEAKEMTNNSKKKSKQAWWICYGALGITAITCYWLKFAWLWPLALIALVYAFLTNRKYNHEYENYTKMLSSEIGTAKIQKLNEALLKYGYQQLDNNEATFAEITNAPVTKEPKGFTTQAVICAILTIILIASSFVVHDNNLHSYKYVYATVAGMSHEYIPDVSGYGYACYYIYADLEIYSKVIGVENISVKIYVKNKKDDELGTMTTSLSRVDIKPGETKTITTTFEERYPENNAFFTQIYNSNFNELKFEIEIESIDFSD
ncbi:MAG: hypothetical protein KBS41_03825 [Oscillospiraceae bacterium]|nr:hypothetical protein [Candidatus Equicaccousia limihippi]